MRPSLILPALGLMLCIPVSAARAIDIPVNTWVAVPLPGGNGTHASACDDGECKHERLAYNPVDHRIYVLGGDHSNPSGYTQSGSNEMWSYSVSGNDWRLETPYCLPAGYTQPSHPDEVGFAIDSKRNQFWMYPGYMWSGATCQSNEVYNKPVVYDAASGLWSDPNLPWDTVLVRFSQYDPVGDRVISFPYDGSEFIEHNLASGVVRRVKTIIPPGEDGGDAFIGANWTALDLQNRKLYVIGIKGTGKLYQYDLNTNVFRFMAATPIPTATWEDWVYWSPATQCLLWVYMTAVDPITEVAGQARVFAWHSNTNTWTEIPITPPVDMQGNPVVDASGNPIEVKGRQGVFDPVENAMVIYGVSGSDPVPYLFLYRYSEGPPDTAPPSPPANLRSR